MSQVTLKIEEGIACISVVRPEALNALNREIVDEMDQLLDQVEKDDSARCLIFYSEKNFAAGADIKAMAECDEEGQKLSRFLPSTTKLQTYPCRPLQLLKATPWAAVWNWP